MIKFDEFGGVYLISWFPGIIAFGVSFPFDEILKSSGPAMTSVVNNLLHFIFFFSINQVRWWSGEVGSVCCGFLIW